MKIVLAFLVTVALASVHQRRESHSHAAQHRREQRISTIIDDGTLPLSLTDNGLIELYGDDAAECLVETVEGLDYFPTDEQLDDMTDEMLNEIKEDSGEVPEGVDPHRRHRPVPECKKCCKIGAYAGKKYRHKGKCPYLECRRLFKMFYRKYRKHIKHAFRCGFAFVKCCERQHFKELYERQAQESSPPGARYDWDQHEVRDDAIDIELREFGPAQPQDTYEPQEILRLEPAETFSSEDDSEESNEVVDEILAFF